MRGKKEVQDFAQEMLEVLNMPHNIQKGHVGRLVMAAAKREADRKVP